MKKKRQQMVLQHVEFLDDDIIKYSNKQNMLR